MKNQNQDHILSNKAYDVLKYIVEVILPGVGTLYFTLGQIWGLPNGNEVVGTCAAIALFLGLMVGYSRRSYDKSDAKYDGVIDVTENEDGVKQAALVLKNYENPADVVEQKEVRFKVDPPK